MVKIYKFKTIEKRQRHSIIFTCLSIMFICPSAIDVEYLPILSTGLGYSTSNCFLVIIIIPLPTPKPRISMSVYYNV